MLIMNGSRGASDDRGFTVVEVTISAAIMFFVATALFGLVTTSTMLGVTAKADAVAVNAGNAFLERVRQLPYDQVTQTRVNALAADSSATVDGIAVSIRATVTPQWFGDQNPAHVPAPFKHVAVTITATGPAGRPFTLTTGTYVGNIAWGTVGATGSPGPGTGPSDPPPTAPPPTISLTANTPTDGAVRGSGVDIGMDASAGNAAVRLQTLRLTAGGSLLAERLGLNLENASLTHQWNTALVDVGGNSVFPDGPYEIRALARDTLGQQTVRAWSLIVDNHPPSPPGNPTVMSVAGNTGVTFGWTPGMDGPSEVGEYDVRWFQQPNNSSTFTEVGSTVVASTQWSPAATASFSRYRVDVRSRGLLAQGGTTPFHNSGWSNFTYISRPSFAASVIVTDVGGPTSRARLDIDLRSHTPSFQSSSITYRWQYRYGMDATSTPWTDIPEASASDLRVNDWTGTRWFNGRFRDGWIEFRCLVVVTPVGGSAVSVPSSFARFTRGENTRGPATRGSDQWERWLTPPAVTPAVDWGMWGL